MNECNKCNPCSRRKDCGGCGPCSGGGCCPAKYSCNFSIQASPYDPYTWLVTNCSMTHKVKIPKLPESCTYLSLDPSTLSLIYRGECDTQIITGEELGSIIKLNDLADVEAEYPESCSMLVYDPHCENCGNDCYRVSSMWRPYHIPDAEDCVMEPNENGYYEVLIKDDCGCIKECQLPSNVPEGTVINYQRDSVPDDPDFPWYYGNYNDRINLHLAENYPDYFGKFDLKVTINYGIQAIKSDNYDYNYNWRSIVVPVVEGEFVRITQEGSILQNWCIAARKGTGPGQIYGGIPWGSSSLRGSFTFIVPKGKDAYLHHEYRIRNEEDFPEYHFIPGYDGKNAGNIGLNDALHPASRLNALQVIIEPINRGVRNYEPVKDADRAQLDEPIDEYGA